MNQASPFKLFVFFAVLLSGSVFAAKGKDGNDTIAANTVVNYYDSVTNIQNGANIIVTVNNINTLTDIQGLYADANLSAGDKVMLYQAQGATYSTANDSSPTYGAFNLNEAGRYEVHEVLSVSGNDITLAEFGNLCTADQLIYSFDLTKTQLIRMPQFNNLTISGGSVVSASPWNGSTGGVVAIDVAATLNLAGQIDVTGLGFRGGILENFSSPAGQDRPEYYYIDDNDGAEKGESVIGFQAEYDAYGGRYGRGAPANGGGGGNGHNSGGGGGANGGDIAGWNGQGNPDLSDNSWTAAWDIDGTLTSATTSSGGGRGGYTYGSSDQNALTEPPGGSWGGNLRRERGGLGGRPLPFDDAGRLFFGGGGGAGAHQWQTASPGGGGGVLYDAAFSVVAGTESVTVGSGGAPGTVISSTITYADDGEDSVFSTLTAIGGGRGGHQNGDGIENLPGSGGSGGGAGAGTEPGGTGTSGQGHDGGGDGLGGGGGAGEDGEDSAGSDAGDGGEGLSYDTSGTAVVYGSGGASDGSNVSTPGVPGTNAGLGTGSGVANTGGGGGGVSNTGGADVTAGAGGSGVVIISVPAE